MFAKYVLVLLLAASVHWPTASNAQSTPSNGMADKGLIIRVMDRLLFIDMGRQEGVQAGDIFDIVDSEVVTHPLSGDTLSITPRSIGALQVRQVYPKMALAELMHIQAARDPMLMRIAPIENSERLLEVEQFLKRNMISGGPSLKSAWLPGVYQYKTGSTWKGLGLLGLELATLGGGIAFRISSDEWYDTYSKLSPGLSPDRYDYYFNGASDRRTMSNRLFWLAGALYAYNLIDVLWMGNDRGGPNLSRKLSLGVTSRVDGAPLLQLTRSF